ncbi:hypothetical protein OHB26_05250 [Nocardia sp. NBC_01503]|uniref:hypothetical protein n=1 Tax=Nocardia sp. NBC_01503 TaxID=2975997 RepID=UPI002E7C1B1E|nr:hypothetical protein [Nocardia sp. NBC_01503]WTL33643.1 hypothetical protein OHB26_05250 [Nocardia sp. NBC_01503]
MRSTLFVMSVLGAATVFAPLASAQPPAGDSAVKVQAVYGVEQFPIAGVTADVTPCAGGAATTVTTATDGSATYTGGSGCYRVQVATPSGCALDGDAAQQVSTVPGITPTATFRFRCA